MDVLSVFSIALLLLVFVSVRRAHIRVEYSVSWLTAAIVLLICSRSPSFVHWLAALMGIDYPPLALFLIVCLVFLVVFYRFSIRISDLKDVNIALTQRVAILEYQIKSANGEQEKTKDA